MQKTQEVSILAIFKDRVLVGNSKDSFIAEKPKFEIYEGGVYLATQKFDEFSKLVSSYLTKISNELKEVRCD